MTILSIPLLSKLTPVDIYLYSNRKLNHVIDTS